MKTFTTPDATVWKMSIDLPTAKRLHDVLGFNLYSGEDLKKLYADPALFADVLYVTCRDQANVANVTSEAFGQQLLDVFVDATTKWSEELRLFFQKLGRSGLAAVAAKAAELFAVEQTAIVAKAESPKVDETVTALLAKDMADFESELTSLVSGAQSTNSPA